MKCPYKELYIYLADRRISEREEKLLGENYLGNWIEDDLSFLFFTRPEEERLKKLSIKIIEKYQIPYEQWHGEMYDSIKIGEFIIVPFWNTEKIKDDNVIILDPNVVFGNCLHPTTRDSLKAISLIFKEYMPKKVLDLGTGTGILAIASARLGAEEVIAVDINPICIRVAKKNINLNKLEDKIEVLLEDAALTIRREKADLVIANIGYQVIKKIIDFLEAEYFVFSGILRSEISEARLLIEKRGYKIKEFDHEMTWYTMFGRRKR